MFTFKPQARDEDFYRWLLDTSEFPTEVDEEWSVQKIKSHVRQRDGYKCRDCGMTDEEHQQKHQQTLNVHRLVPGLAYRVDWCVTLCVDCHNKKPRKTEDAFWAADLRWFGFNLYAPEHKLIWERVMKACREADISPGDFVTSAILQRLDNPPLDFTI